MSDLANLDKQNKSLAIKVDSLSKVYPLYNSPRDRLKEALHPRRKKYHKEFFALRDISFEVNKGDSLGIIGHNGSGKSTLLKILSKVISPTTGTFQISGRVISLLELGAGFNPDLTGIENIYFYGTILGFTKKKIETKLDEIISFSDIGQFVYQPLKTYSSGMKSRLAFAVASHVDPDILILDEVLAVGDLRFKQKCFRVMRDIVDQKKTILLVSHSIGSVNSFCNKALWLNEGQIMDFGVTGDITKKYVAFMTYGLETQKKGSEKVDIQNDNTLENKTITISEKKQNINQIKWIDVSKLESFGEKGAEIQKLAIYHRGTDIRVETLKGGEWLSVYAMLKINTKIENPGFGLKINDKHGSGIFSMNNYMFKKDLLTLNQQKSIIIQTDFRLPLLMSGKYPVAVAIADGNQEEHIQHHWIHDAFFLTVEDKGKEFKGQGPIIRLDNQDYNICIVS